MEWLTIETGIMIWAVGVILAMLCFIFFWGFDDGNGNIEVTGTRILCYVLMSLIGNWAFVVFYLGLGGIWIIVQIGEWLGNVFDFTIYESKPVNNRKKQ